MSTLNFIYLFFCDKTAQNPNIFNDVALAYCVSAKQWSVTL